MARISDQELAAAWFSNDNIRDLEIRFEMTKHAINARWCLLKDKGMLPRITRNYPKPLPSARFYENRVSSLELAVWPR